MEVAPKGMLAFAELRERDKKRKGEIKWLKKGEKLMYFAVLIALLIFLIVQTAKCVLRYLEEPIYTDTQTVDQKDSIFPATTFCVETNRIKVEVLQVRSL